MKRRDHIHSVIVSYNRLELTQQATASYRETVTLPHTLVVVDNGSDEETLEWLSDNRNVVFGHLSYQLVTLGQNRYPGFATNRGWERMPPETTLLHRADNDFVFSPGWDQHG